MKTQTAIFALFLLIASTTARAEQTVSSAFFGSYKLTSNIEGECPENIAIIEKRSSDYAIWVTFTNASGKFIKSAKFDYLNNPVEVSNYNCVTAGPRNPFCIESRKQRSTYDPEKLILENFYGLKKSYRNAKFRYVKIQVKEEGLEVEFKEMEKPMVHAVFSFSPLESAATVSSNITLPVIKNNFLCNYNRE